MRTTLPHKKDRPGSFPPLSIHSQKGEKVEREGLVWQQTIGQREGTHSHLKSPPLFFIVL